MTGYMEKIVLLPSIIFTDMNNYNISSLATILINDNIIKWSVDI